MERREAEKDNDVPLLSTTTLMQGEQSYYLPGQGKGGPGGMARRKRPRPVMKWKILSRNYNCRVLNLEGGLKSKVNKYLLHPLENQKKQDNI